MAAPKKKKILVVDDEIDLLEMLKARLEANNYNVIATSNGKEAIDLVAKFKPDAVFLDIMMPGIDGLDILKKIRFTDNRLPVFIITAFSNEERRNAARQLNASGYILKTGDLQTEIEKIGPILDIAARYKI